ncbi:pentapeptide repeat-containing protein [Saccharopolyspora cebuensis]|uniref:Pentapeptide repeat-containing protein n=1 Tax=Saccharopolyspora cebuensis TaxID=418759 RepID=A0ABV4CS50_9PSEU
MTDDRGALRADCARCTGLCCVALPFTASADFAVDKAAGEPCRNLLADFGCGIHAELRDRGYPGCTVFDCFGAGQQTSAHTFAGRDWRREPGIAREMFDVFGVLRQLHELRWYVAEALAREAAAPVHEDLRADRAELARLADAGPDELRSVDVPAVRARIDQRLTRVSELVRSSVPGRRRDHRGADLIGARLRRADLRGARLRGAYLIAADLRGADLAAADLIGADLRDADLRGADLAESLFLTQPQVAAAKGDAATRIPAALDRPAHWTA